MEDEEEIVVVDYDLLWKEYLLKHCGVNLGQIASEFPYYSSLHISIRELAKCGKDGLELADVALTNPRKAVRDIRSALKIYNLIFSKDDSDNNSKIYVRFTDLPRKKQISGLRQSDIGHLVAVDGIVENITQVVNRLSEGVFQCPSCGMMIRVKQNVANADIDYPTECPHCEAKRKCKILPEFCLFEDYQILTLQELQEDLQSGRQPDSIAVELHGDIVGTITAGNRATITGAFMAVNVNKRSKNFRKYIHCHSYELHDRDHSDIEYSDEDVEKIKAIVSVDAHKAVVSRIAPFIYGYEKEKLAIGLQQFGGVQRAHGSEYVRGDIHILLVGDPSVAKSRMIGYVADIIPGGVIASGKGSSSAGLTASVTNDPNTGQWQLRAGTLVLANGGLAVIDEMDKMSAEDRSSMHEAMEQQTIHINKAGINATLTSRCPVLGAANPKMGRFDDYKPLPEQIDMPPSLVSRFDLLFVLRDIPKSEVDRMIAEKVFDSHTDAEREIPELDDELLVKWIAYAKREIRPVLSAGARDRLLEYYLDLRKTVRDCTISMTARQLEGLIRIAEASARCRLSETASIYDAQVAIDLMSHSLQSSGLDPDTGKVDVDKMCGKIRASQKSKMDVLLSSIAIVCEENDVAAANWADVVARAMDMGLTTSDIEVAKNTLVQSAQIFEPRPGKTVRIT